MYPYESAVVTTPDAEQLARLRRLTHALYALYALYWLTFGCSALVAIIINYLKRDDARGTLYASHFRWQIRTFWWCVLWGAIGGVLVFVLIGFVVLWGLGFWMLYRIVKGWLRLNDGQPMYAGD